MTAKKTWEKLVAEKVDEFSLQLTKVTNFLGEKRLWLAETKDGILWGPYFSQEAAEKALPPAIVPSTKIWSVFLCPVRCDEVTDTPKITKIGG